MMMMKMKNKNYVLLRLNWIKKWFEIIVDIFLFVF